MRLISRLLHWTTLPAGRRLMAVLGAVLAIVLVCNPALSPLLPVVDALGLDVLMLLLGVQVVAALPRVREGRARDQGACTPADRRIGGSCRWLSPAARVVAGMGCGDREAPIELLHPVPWRNHFMLR